jgi:hypothetical protein
MFLYFFFIKFSFIQSLTFHTLISTRISCSPFSSAIAPPPANKVCPITLLTSLIVLTPLTTGTYQDHVVTENTLSITSMREVRTSLRRFSPNVQCPRLLHADLWYWILPRSDNKYKNAYWNSFTPLCKVWLSLRRFSRNLKSLKMLRKSPVLTSFQSGRKIQKWREKVYSRPEVKCGLHCTIFKKLMGF